MTDVEAIRSGDRRALARAITLIESTRAADQERAEALLADLGPTGEGSWRIGISGAPGVGKSTFIEAFGSTPWRRAGRWRYWRSIPPPL